MDLAHCTDFRSSSWTPGLADSGMWTIFYAQNDLADMGCRRDLYSSDKIAEISYASELSLFFMDCNALLTVTTAFQGKGELVNKFRNSSVMLVESAYRPKVGSGCFRPKWCWC